MEEIKKIEGHIKNKWFKNHKATVFESDKVTILDWREPGTNMYSVRYIFAGSNLYISGDIGDAIFDLTWEATIESFEDVGLGYLLGKLSCHSRDRWNYNEYKAVNELNEWYEDAAEDAEDDYLRELEELKTNLSEIIESVDSSKELELRLFDYYMENSFSHIDSEDFSMFADYGKELPHVFVAYLLGIQLAIGQIKVSA